MGYRSNVMALIYPDVAAVHDTPGVGESKVLYEQLKTIMATTFKAVSDEFGDPYMVWLDREYVLRFDIPDVKWYPSYPDVQMFTQMVSAFQDDIPGYCTEFVRVGEEAEDVDTQFTGEDCQHYLSVRTSIDCNI